MSKRRQLIALAKKHGIRANLKLDVIEEQIGRIQRGEAPSPSKLRKAIKRKPDGSPEGQKRSRTDSDLSSSEDGFATQLGEVLAHVARGDKEDMQRFLHTMTSVFSPAQIGAVFEHILNGEAPPDIDVGEEEAPPADAMPGLEDAPSLRDTFSFSELSKAICAEVEAVAPDDEGSEAEDARMKEIIAEPLIPRV